jgi:site-specific recombinase XerD
MKKRKDSNGRVLRKGEFQRSSDGMYIYKYQTPLKVQKRIAASTLDELRKLEKELDKEAKAYSDPTLYQQITLYLNTRKNLRDSTLRNYRIWLEALKDDYLLKLRVKQVKTIHVKTWIADKIDEGKSSSTINAYFTGLIRPALQMAVEDELIYRNPADFKLSNTVTMSSSKREALTPQEQQVLINFLERGECVTARKNRDLFIFALETGLRASEIGGLTVNDIDFDKKEISVNKQLIREGHLLRIDTPKSESGKRIIPMSAKAEECLRNVLSIEHDKDYEVDGYSGFVFRSRRDQLMDRIFVRSRYIAVVKAIEKESNVKLPSAMHCLRHTYCTNLINANVNVKVVQYLMGHKNAATTMDIYTTVTEERVRQELLEKFK